MYAAIRVFNNEKTIKECLLSLLPYINKIVIVDGAYMRFPHELKTGASTDKTKEICHRICNSKSLKWVDSEKPLTEINKNNLMLEYIPIGKWFLWIDADEIIEGNITEAIDIVEKSNYQCAGVPIKNFHPIWHGYKIKRSPRRRTHPRAYLDPPIPEEEWGDIEWNPYYGVSGRFIRRVPKLHFRGHHHRLYIDEKLMKYETSLDSVMIINRQKEVGWKRWHQKTEYKKECYEMGEWR